MLRDRVITEIANRLPELRFQTGTTGQPFLTIPAPSPLLGALEIHDDGEEATVYAGDLSHGHYNPYDSGLSPQAREAWIAEKVVDFLEAAVADRVLFWATQDRHRGGWLRLDYGEAPEIASDAVMTVWSGPWTAAP